MNITSHFIAIELNNELFWSLFLSLEKYLQDNDIENIIELQNKETLHITLYYLEKNLSEENIESILTNIDEINLSKEVYVHMPQYFYRDDKRYVLYLDIKTDIDLKEYRNFFHDHYSRTEIEENNFSFTPHVTLWRIRNHKIYETHRDRIEKIILTKLEELTRKCIQTWWIFLYTADSTQAPELQLKVRR